MKYTKELLEKLYKQYGTQRKVAKALNARQSVICKAMQRCGLYAFRGLEKMPEIFTEEQKQLVYGSIMGDGYLSVNILGKRQRNSVSLTVNHSFKQLEYAKWKFGMLKPFMAMENVKHKIVWNKQVQKYYKTVHFMTRQHPWLKEIGLKSYNHKKIVNQEILDSISELGLAVWFMDDGSTRFRKESRYMMFHTDGFTKKENEVIISWFNKKWNIFPKICEQLDGNYSIYFNKYESEKLINIIKPHIHPSMNYKLTPQRPHADTSKKVMIWSELYGDIQNTAEMTVSTKN